MARNESPPFDLGTSFYGGGVIDLTNNPDTGNLIGKEYVFEPGRITGLAADGPPITARIVRNTGATNLKPKRIAAWDTAPPSGMPFGGCVSGYTDVENQAGAVVDPLGPPAGFPANDLFFVIVRGPAIVKTPNSAGIAAAIGSVLVAITAATAGASDAGAVNLAAATITATNMVNRVGRAMAALTSGQTAHDLLVLVGW